MKDIKNARNGRTPKNTRQRDEGETKQKMINYGKKEKDKEDKKKETIKTEDKIMPGMEGRRKIRDKRKKERQNRD